MPEDAPRTPLIVCGFPRSGTWGCAHMLGNSNEVELQGELMRPAETLGFLEQAKTHWAAQADQRRSAAKLHELAFDLFKGMSASKTVRRPAARFAGHKTPRHERLFDRYEALFDHPAARPRYVYCLRNPFDVWQSNRMMPWNRFGDARAFAGAWAESCAAFDRMRAAAPGRVLRVNLDALKAADDVAAWWMAALFDPLGIRRESFRRPLGEVPMNNSAEEKLGEAPPPLDEAERAVIAGSPGVRAVLEREFAGLVGWPEPPARSSLWDRLRGA